jgi:hypothetical protein
MLKIVNKKQINVLAMLVFGAAIGPSAHDLAAGTAAVGSALRNLSAASESSSNSETKRQYLPEDGGLPGAVLRAHFAALKVRDWNALKAVTAGDIREMMEEDEADGAHLDTLNAMRKKSPHKIDVLQGWIEDGVAHVRYQGQVDGKLTKGQAELTMEDGQWKMMLAGLEK